VPVDEHHLVEVQREARFRTGPAILDQTGRVAAVTAGGVQVVALLAGVEDAVAAGGVGQLGGEGRDAEQQRGDREAEAVKEGGGAGGLRFEDDS